MSRFLSVSVVVLLIVGCTLAFPSSSESASEDEKREERAEVAKVDKPVSEEKTVLVSEESGWNTFLSGGDAWTVVTGSLATLFLVGGLALGYYYFFYLSYYKTADSGNVDPYSSYGGPGYSGNYAYAPAPPYYASAARALQGSSFSFTDILDMIAMAQETYEKFDFQSLDCQKKALCELQQKKEDFGETGRKITSTLSFMDAIEGLPMPTIIQTYLKEYKEAVMQGKNSTKECSSIYPTCNFSVKEIFVKYYTKRSNKPS